MKKAENSRKNELLSEFESLKRSNPNNGILKFKNELVKIFSDDLLFGDDGPEIYHSLAVLMQGGFLTPVEDSPEYWITEGEHTYHVRSRSIAKCDDGYVYGNAIVFFEDKGDDINIRIGCAYSNGEPIYVVQGIKKFPFEPITFEIEVLKHSSGNYIVKNPADLEKVWEYYEMTVQV